jgi:hypothetical protein
MSSSPFCTCCPLLWAIVSFGSLDSKKDGNDPWHLYDKGPKIPLAAWTTSSNEDNYPWGGCTLEQEQSSYWNQFAPSGDDRDNNSSGTSENQNWDDVNQATLWLGLFMPPALILCLFKVKAHSVPQRWLKMGWVLTWPLLMACPRLCNKSPFSSLCLVFLFGV